MRVNTVRSYLLHHHVALVALLLVLVSGTAYAAKVHLPKNSVASKQVKNASLQGKDLRDGTVTGADVADGSMTGAEVADGSVSGTDLQDGTVGAKDLSDTAVPITRPVLVRDVSGGDSTIVVSDPAVGTISFGCGPAATDMIVFGLLPVSAQPGSVRVTGHDLTDNVPVGASTASSTIVTPSPFGAGFSGAAVVPQGTVFLNSATKRTSLAWDVSGCVLRGLLVITDKTAQPDLTPARGTPAEPTCVEVGDAHCVLD